MVKPNGSGDHEYRISNLTIPYAPINQTNSTVIQGTTSITMRDGLVTNEQTTITLRDKDTFVYFNPSKIDNHFRNQSIVGVITKQTFAE
ncbi:MAG TPA: hypothetical protein VFG45_13235 [Candidatus Nitrosocosmicus sp.]|nr:hypothetical protein [Candidatus Nitrosocosmicus sp.]